MMMLAVMACANVYAAAWVKFAEGDKKFFKTASGDAVLTIDWSEASYDGRETLEQKYGDFTPYAAAARNGFIQDFNPNCKTVQIVEDEAKAKYEIKIKVSKVDQYFKVTGFVPGNATKIWGELTITDRATGTLLFKMTINEADGGASPSPYETFSDVFEFLGKAVTRFK